MSTILAAALCRYDGVVEYEYPDTWPVELKALFEREFACLEAYEHRRAEVDAICREDVMARINPPPNVYKEKRTEVVQQADAILAVHRLQGFHCTRLTETELSQIKSEGLRPLSTALVRERLERVVVEGLLTAELKHQLIAEHQADDVGRIGMTHFVNCRSMLASEGDVGRLFRSWGGEALYNCHEMREDTGAALRSIGKPAIVVTAIPIPILRVWFASASERFLWKFLDDRGVPIDHAAYIETHTTEAVPAGMILDIITFNGDQFGQLTECAEWADRID